jgi:hypothetical protein
MVGKKGGQTLLFVNCCLKEIETLKINSRIAGNSSGKWASDGSSRLDGRVQISYKEISAGIAATDLVMLKQQAAPNWWLLWC